MINQKIHLEPSLEESRVHATHVLESDISHIITLRRLVTSNYDQNRAKAGSSIDYFSDLVLIFAE